MWQCVIEAHDNLDFHNFFHLQSYLIQLWALHLLTSTRCVHWQTGSGILSVPNLTAMKNFPLCNWELYSTLWSYQVLIGKYLKECVYQVRKCVVCLDIPFSASNSSLYINDKAYLHDVKIKTLPLYIINKSSHLKGVWVFSNLLIRW